MTEIPPRAPSALPSDSISLLGIVNALLRHRRPIILIPVAAAVFVVGLVFLSPRSYTASASFTPQPAEGAQGRLAGIAAQFGIPLGTSSSPAQSPEFYADLLVSPAILRVLVEAEYDAVVRRRGGLLARAESQVVRAKLMDLMEVDEPTEAERRETAVRLLRKRLSVSVARTTGVVTLKVTTLASELSKGIADHALSLLEEFNMSVRQSHASAERRFLEERLVGARDDLRALENRLQVFLQQNRTFEQSPELTFTHDRLQREVSVQQQLYLSLAQAYEQARIDEVRNTPIITMIERPIMPVANPRMLFVKVGMALLAGVALACLVAFLREVFSADRRGAAEELQELEELKGAAWGDVERISSRLRHPFGVRSSG